MAKDPLSDAEPAPAPLSWGVKATILAGSTALSLAVSGMSAGLPKIEAALAHGPEDKFLVKMLIGVVGAAMVVGAPLTGFLSDRFGLRRAIFLNYLLFTIAGSSGLFINNLHMLIVARFLVGVGAAGAATVSIIIVNQRLPPDQRAQWMGAYIAAAYVTSIAMHPLVGMLAEINWHYMFALCLAGAPFVVIALTSFEAHTKHAAQTENTNGEPEQSLFSWFPFRFALHALLLGCIVYIPLIYTPFLLRDMGIGPAKISFVLLGDTLTGTLVALLFGYSRRYLSSNGTFLCIFLATGVGTLVTALAPNYLIVMIGYAVTGLGQGWVIPNLMITVGSQVKPQQQGRAAGIVKASNYIAITVCVIATERLSQIYGPRLPILIASALAFGLLSLTIYHVRSLRRRNYLGNIKSTAA